MNDQDYFVMLATQNGGYTPLMDSNSDNIAKFKTAEEARKAAKNSVMGEMFGFSIFDIADGWS
ncbi:hypothetical protein [Endozoicomonas arenosclerae]|uniref:hypothetical protein n=1 Tax=Endozoicomonas arenosclerae TaxID=1633495 RepID=UPI000782791D|nr:hypothetical protein [Endozoicomonas arenosclerae]